MADTKVSLLAEATSVNNTDIVPIVQSGTSKKASIARLNRKVMNYSTAAQSPTAATATIITGSSLAIPTGATIVADSVFQWKIVMSKTAAGTGATTFTMRLGTAGTTADAIVLTLTTTAATAAIDAARFDILVNVRTAGASGILQGTLSATKQAAATAGWFNVPTQTVTATSSATNLTAANLIASLAVTTGAATVATINQVVSEVVNV